MKDDTGSIEEQKECLIDTPKKEKRERGSQRKKLGTLKYQIPNLSKNHPEHETDFFY